MTLTIRPARAADAPLVIEFNRLLALESEGKALDLALLKAGVEAAVTDEAKCRYFLAEDAGLVVGQLGLSQEWSDWRNGWFWWLQSVYVRGEHRQKGVFRALFAHVRTLALDT